MHTGGGVSPRNFQATQKYHFSFSPLYKNLHMNIKYPETCKKRSELPLVNPEISVHQSLMSKNIINIISILFGPKNITLGNRLTQKYWTYFPVYTCAKCKVVNKTALFTLPTSNKAGKTCLQLKYHHDYY